MRRSFILSIVAASAIALIPAVSAEGPAAPAALPHPSIASFLKPGLPIELVSARKADRIAWIAYEEGRRNVFTAAGPLFRATRATSFMKDDGTDLTGLRISDDGSTIVFVRGSAPNSAGWVANPAGDPNGAERAIWAMHVATPGVSHRLAEGNNAEVSPDGRFVLYVKEGQIYRARTTPAPAPTKVDTGDKPFINDWGRQSGPKWSPDGTRLLFSTNRTTHSFIGIYDTRTKLVSYLSPGVDRDTSPAWSPDGRKVVFIRRPGLPFGQQSSPGSGTQLPELTGRGGRGGNAPPAAPATGRGAQPDAQQTGRGRGGRQGGAQAQDPTIQTTSPVPISTTPPGQVEPQGRGQGGGRGGRGGGDFQVPPDAPLGQQPGLYRATLPGGYTMALMVADAATGEAHAVWHPEQGSQFAQINNIQWANDVVVFTMLAKPTDESASYYSLNISGQTPPVQLTTTEGIIEDATAAELSVDGKTLYYCTNTNDIDRRHIWAVSTAGGTPQQLTTGDGIENVPVPIASGKQIAVLSADAKRPLSVGLWPAKATPADVGQRAQKVIYPTLGADFPMASIVAPTNVTLKAADGVEFHNQLFLPKDLKPGEKRPALIFVHGGPARQMLLGWHYLSFYHVFYGVNQWLTSQGYIVLSVNYRSGIGYGRAFRQAPQTGGRGNSEYQDVLAAGKWLAARPDVDPDRVGIWGLSYGGLLTAQALARNSDIFKLGIDLAGVHVQGSALDPEAVSYRSSAISEIDNWKSPVLLVHGDDDRNVNFSQTVGLVQLLRARNVYHELIVFPNDVHETLLHSRWLYTFDRMEAFLNKFFGEYASTRGGGGR